LRELISRVNWVDLFALILLVRISYVSSKIGVGKQILPLALLALILLITLHYYAIITAFVADKLGFSQSISAFFVYFFMTLLFLALYRFLLRITNVFFAGEEGPGSSIEKTGGTVLGVLRAVLIIGLVTIGLLLAPVRFLENGVKSSFSGPLFVEINVRFYTAFSNLIFRGKNVSYEKVLSALYPDKKDYLFNSSDLKKRSKFHNEKY